MDFTLDEQQTVVRDLARQIIGDLSTADNLRRLDRDGAWFDRALWRALASAGLLGVALAEEHGGLGLGFVEMTIVCEELGRHAAAVPYLPTALAGNAIANHGPDALRTQWLPKVTAGDAVLTFALTGARDAVLVDAGGNLSGQVSFVPAGLDAHLVLVPAVRDDDGIAVCAVETAGRGVTVEAQPTVVGAPEARLTFDGAPAVAFDFDGEGLVEGIRQRAVAGLCAIAAGVTAAAVDITASYVREREQFGKPLASFQAVSQRAADAYVDAKAIRLTAMQAAWRIAAGEPALREVAIAKFWASEGGQRVLASAMHLHGGIGVDRDYPVHRYFLAARSIDLTLGTAQEHLVRLGDELARTPAG